MESRLSFPPTCRLFNVHSIRLDYPSAAVITQVDSVSQRIFASGLRLWTWREGKTETLCSFLLSFSLLIPFSIVFLYSLHVCDPPKYKFASSLTSCESCWERPPWGKQVKQQQKMLGRRERGQQGDTSAHVHLQGLMNDEDNDWWYLGGLGENTWVVPSNTHTDSELHGSDMVIAVIRRGDVLDGHDGSAALVYQSQ